MRGRILAGALILTGLATSGWAVGEATATPAGARTAATASGSLPAVSGLAGAGHCGLREITAVAVIRPGTPATALARLAHPPLARLADRGSGGELAFFSPAGVPRAGARSPLRLAAQAVLPDPRLQSCSYLLQDRPAARPYIAAAVAAAVRDRLAATAGELRAKLKIVLIGDNPLQAGSLIITLLTSGPKVGIDPAGHIIFGAYRSVFVVLSRATMHVTGIAAGRWPG